MTPQQISQILPGLKGAQLSILVTFALSHFKITFGRNQLATITGYSRPAISQALQALQVKGLAQQLGRYDSWVATTATQQLLLPLPDESDALGVEGKNFTLPPRGRGSSYTSSNEGDLIEHKTTTTTNEVKKITLPNDKHIESAIEFFQKYGCPRRVYQPALLTALNNGWSTQRIATAVKLWDIHVRHKNDHAPNRSKPPIRLPPFYIATRIKELDIPPHDDPYGESICLECGHKDEYCTCETQQEEMTQ